MVKQPANEKAFNYKRFLNTVLSHRLLFMCGIITALIAAFCFNRLATQEYKISAKILIKEPDKSNESKVERQFSSNISSFFSNQSDSKNELQILKSRSVLEKVIKDLNLNVKVLKKSNLTTKQVFNGSPFKVSILYKQAYFSKHKFEIEILDNNSFSLVSDGGPVSTSSFNKIISTKPYNFVLLTQSSGKIPTGKYTVVVSPFEEAIEELSSRYEAVFSDKDATAIDLALNYPDPGLGEAVLKQIMFTYLSLNKRSKQQLADSALAIVDNRLAMVSNDLITIENKLANYRSSNNIADMGEQSKVLISNAGDYNKRIQEQQTNYNVIEKLEQFLTESGNRRAIPSSLTIENASFENALTTYNSLLLDREKQSLSYTESNPVIENIDKQIVNAYESLLQNIRSYKGELELGLRDVKAENASLNSQIKSIPQKEQMFGDFSRQQELKQNLYLYLLQKREEIAISKLAETDNSNIIDEPKRSYNPVKPRKSLSYLIALFAGIIIPLSYVVVSDKSESRLMSLEDIEDLTEIDIIGEIGRNTSPVLDLSGPSNSVTTENFRNLRTNLCLSDDGKAQVIMITSATIGEGKTFVTNNLGGILGLAGKKTLLIDLDFRKPRLSSSLGIKHSSKGVLNYLSGSKEEISNYIIPCADLDNCYILPPGDSQLGNNADLLLNEKFSSLINILRQMFDYILIDTSPVGLVSDALLIAKAADTTLYVCRQNYTSKAHLAIANKLAKEKIKNMYLVINDIDFRKSGYYGYGYVGYASESKSRKLIPALSQVFSG